MIGSFLAYIGPTLRHIAVHAILQVLRIFYPPLDGLLRRLHESPGIPVANPSSPYWTRPSSPISRHNSSPAAPFPEYADIVIIGSGITGTSFARTILDGNHNNIVAGCGNNKQQDQVHPRIVMLEARDACSGATGRNGGHITPVLYQDYTRLKQQRGMDMARKIIRFRLAHVGQLLAVAKEEGLLDDSQCREVEAFDVYHDKGLFRKALSWLSEYRADLPEESANFRVYDKPEQLTALQLSTDTIGCISTRAGAVHPYRLVTGILSRLLTSYQSNFDLYTHTPCTEIKADDDGGDMYTVETPRGSIRARHVIHATNGWASHLLPGMRGKIFPARGVMTAQTPRHGLGNPDAEDEPKGSVCWSGTRSFVFYPSSTVGVYDYLTQQQVPSSRTDGGAGSSYPEPDGEMMLGGGFTQAIVADVGNADDRHWNPKVEEYLRHALGPYFSVEGAGGSEEKDAVRSIWSGVLGMSADERPWVGQIPEAVSGRKAGGEWIAAGYSGEGMVHGWLSGCALACMVLGIGSPNLPPVFEMSEDRWRKADFEGFVESFGFSSLLPASDGLPQNILDFVLVLVVTRSVKRIQDIARRRAASCPRRPLSMAVVLPTDWQYPTRDPTMDNTNSPRQQRSSPANDHTSPQQAQSHQNVQQQLLMSQQQSLLAQSPYTFPAQQQPQGGWTPSINATPFYPSFYQPQLQQQPGQPFNAQLPNQAAYMDQANAQLAQWAYQQMMFNAQHGFPPGMPPQHHSPAQRPGGGPLPNAPDYFTQNQIPSPFNNFPSGTPPPHAQRGGAGDHQPQHSAPYPGFHPYRRPNRQQSHSSNTPDTSDWRSAPTINHPPHAPYMRSDASGSTSSVNSNNSSQRQRTNSNQSGHSGHSVPTPPPGPGSRSRSNTGSSAASSSARNTPPPAPPPSQSASSPIPSQRNPHHRNGSASSSSSSTATATSTRPPGITPSMPTTATSPATTSASSSSSTTSSSTSPSPVPRLTRPSPLSQGNFTAAEKRMSRDDSDLAAMMSTQPTAIHPSRSGGLKGRLRRALSFNPTQTLKEDEMEQDDDVSIKASALNGAKASSSKLKGKAAALPADNATLAGSGTSKAESSRSPLPDDASSTATVQTKKKGRAASLFNARFNASTDNISLSSTVSSASVMIRKLGSLGNIARRNSLAGITSLFKDKDKDKEGSGSGADKDKKKKNKKGAKAEVSVASVSHVTAELDRTGDWTVGTDMNGLTPAAKLARQHTLKSNAEAAARAKEKAEREASAAASAANDALAKTNAARTRANGAGSGGNGVAGVPSWDKNTATRNGAVPPKSGGSVRIAEDGTRVLLEDDEEESEDGHYGSSHGHQYYNAEGWEDDEDWDAEAGEVEEDATIRQELQRTSLDDNHDVEPWAVDIRRSVERTRIPTKGILKYAGTYDQASYFNSHNAPQIRARSNSYDSPASQSEVGPLAHVPSTDPDHIDGIHRHNSLSSQHDATSESGPVIPSLPPLTFDSSSSRISMSFVSGSKEAKQLKDLPDPPAASGSTTTVQVHAETSNRTSAIFQNPSFNSSAPVLSTIGTSASAPTMPHRSATSPAKRLTFATSMAVYDTFSASMYDRRSEPATWSRLTPALAQRIKEELNSYKMEEMEVHASSRVHTQFFV